MQIYMHKKCKTMAKYRELINDECKASKGEDFRNVWVERIGAECQCYGGK